MKKRLPAIVTILLLLGALGFLARRERVEPAGVNGNEPGPPGPEETIWRMADAARAGDVKSYLDCFGDDLQQRLRQTAAEMGDAQFSDYLKQLDREITGLAVSDLNQSPGQSAAQEAELRVEFVYRSKNEAQKHRLKLLDGKWKIVGLDDAERTQAPFPYGMAVKEAVQKSERR
jgi:hypothetical protein